MAHLAGFWRDGAPAIDFIAPDIYFPNFGEIVDGYVAAGTNPLFIPEANRPSDNGLVVNAFRSIGEHDAIGFSPFAIEDASEDEASLIGSLYSALESAAPIILDAQSAGRIRELANSVSFDGEPDLSPMVAELGNARFSVTTTDPWTPRDAQDPASHGAILVWLGDEDFLFLGRGATLTVEPVRGDGRIGFDRVEEGSFSSGAWARGRALNGDQTHQGRHVRLPPGDVGMQRFRIYRY